MGAGGVARGRRLARVVADAMCRLRSGAPSRGAALRAMRGAASRAVVVVVVSALRKAPARPGTAVRMVSRGGGASVPTGGPAGGVCRAAAFADPRDEVSWSVVGGARPGRATASQAGGVGIAGAGRHRDGGSAALASAGAAWVQPVGADGAGAGTSEVPAGVGSAYAHAAAKPAGLACESAEEPARRVRAGETGSGCGQAYRAGG